MQRRDLLAMVAGGSGAGAVREAVAATAAGAPGVDVAPSKPRTYVLVHGAWHGGWCWKHVTPRLRAAGHAVFVPTLTGFGERVHLSSPSINCSTHATDVQNLIAFEDLDDVILVGHSYAGLVIGRVADRIKPRLRHLVFLDAMIPEDGKAFLPPETVAAWTKTAKDGYLLPAPDPTSFGVPADHPDMPWVKRHLTPHFLPALAEAVHYENGGLDGVAKTFIRCTRRANSNGALGDAAEAFVRGKADWTWKTLDSGHDAMVTAPAELTEMLLAIG